ncbi:MAG: DUF4962 domain-containing protein [Verrucomicrobia bacterium]|nr:DUF4962 domain-containing protein [Verrucomicrobiota bacterium]
MMNGRLQAILGVALLAVAWLARPADAAVSSAIPAVAGAVPPGPARAGRPPEAAPGGAGRFQAYRLPDALVQCRGMHPRLFLDAPQLEELRLAVGSSHSNLWQELCRTADRLAAQGPPAYRADDDGSGDEQLWQREVGNALPTLGLVCRLSADSNRLQAVQAWALAACDYPTWGLGRLDGMDLAAGHQLFGLGLLYDWCYHQLDDTVRRRIRETLTRRAGAMFAAGAAGKVWWHRSHLQNHLWVNVCGLTTAGLALFDEIPEAAAWIGFGLDQCRQTMAALGSDGASHEGLGYWEYGVEYLLKVLHLARQRLETDFFDHDWWRETARFPLYLSLPRATWARDNCIVDLADCGRGHWYGPDHLLWALAREYRDPHAQWLAQEIDRAGVAAPTAPWLNVLWHDPSMRALSPHTLPTLHRFADLEIVSARSGWSGDESLLVFKCGPCLGHKAVQMFDHDPGAGHVHPDANHFVLFGAGEWLIRDDGYAAKWTGQHNTLLVDDTGQMGEGQRWYQPADALAAKSRPSIPRAFSSRALDHVIGDATPAYPARLGLQRFARHLLFLKPDVLIVVDDIALDGVRNLELRFHPETNRCARDGEAFVLSGQHALLRLEPLAASGSDAAAEALPARDRLDGDGPPLFTIRLRKQAAQWRAATALSWAPNGQSPKKVTWEGDVHTWRFHAGTNTVDLDWLTAKAALRAPGSEKP